MTAFNQVVLTQIHSPDMCKIVFKVVVFLSVRMQQYG